MNPMIAIAESTIGGELVPTVDARELYEFLDIGRDFSTWVKSRISEYGFNDGTDYTTLAIRPSRPQGGRPTIEYALSLGMAKELAMVERNWRGKQARKYFIECERRWKSQALDLRDPARLSQLALELTGIVKELVAERASTRRVLIEAQPKVEFYDEFVATDGLYSLQNAGRALQLPPNGFIAWLKGWALFYQGKALVPKARFIENGMFQVRNVRGHDGATRLQTMVTPKGLALLARRWQRDQGEAA